MLGFSPEKGTRQNLAYGEALLRESDHGSVLQMHKWWQDRAPYYAFETRGGASGLARTVDLLGSCGWWRRGSPSAAPQDGVSFRRGTQVLLVRRVVRQSAQEGESTVHRCTCGWVRTQGASCGSVLICAVQINSLEYEVLTKIMD